MPGVYEERAKDLLGYVPPFTPVNEEYVTVLYNQDLLDKGFTPARIALRHNGGYATACSSGWNDYDQWYDSCDYVEKFIKIYNTL